MKIQIDDLFVVEHRPTGRAFVLHFVATSGAAAGLAFEVARWQDAETIYSNIKENGGLRDTRRGLELNTTRAVSLDWIRACRPVKPWPCPADLRDAGGSSSEDEATDEGGDHETVDA